MVSDCLNKLDYFDFENVPFESNHSKRLVLEITHIEMNNITINGRSYINNFSNIYKHLCINHNCHFDISEYLCQTVKGHVNR